MGYAFLFAYVAHGVYLVFHQCNQRGYDDCRSLHQQRGKLVTERFSSAGWHEHKGVFTGEHIADYVFLVTFEFVETEIVFQLFSQVNLFRHIVCFSFRRQTKIIKYFDLRHSQACFLRVSARFYEKHFTGIKCGKYLVSKCCGEQFKAAAKILPLPMCFCLLFNCFKSDKSWLRRY